MRIKMTFIIKIILSEILENTTIQHIILRIKYYYLTSISISLLIYRLVKK